jgi:hypothetical protein
MRGLTAGLYILRALSTWAAVRQSGPFAPLHKITPGSIALPGIFKHAILHAIVGITSVEDSLLDHGKLGTRNEAGLIFVNRLRDTHDLCSAPGIYGGRTVTVSAGVCTRPSVLLCMPLALGMEDYLDEILIPQ